MFRFLANLKASVPFAQNTLFIRLSDGFYSIPEEYEFLHSQIPQSLLLPETNDKVLINPKEFIENIVTYESQKKRMLELKAKRDELVEQYNQKTKEINEKLKKTNEILCMKNKLKQYKEERDREKELLDKGI